MESKRPDLKFEAQVRRDLGFLFDQCDAKIISNNYDYCIFGNANIVIKAGDLFFDVVRDRGDVCVYVAPGPVTRIEGRWAEIGIALAAVLMDDSSGKIPDPSSYASLSRAADLLKPALLHLQEGLSESQYEITSRRMRQIGASYLKKLQERSKEKPQYLHYC